MSLPEPTPSAIRARMRELAERGEFAQGVIALERELAAATASDARQDIASSLGELARRAEAAGEFESARRALEVATGAVEWADLFCALGCLLVRRGRRAEAREALDRALAINPRYRTAVVERALLDARDGRIGEAMQTLRVLASETPVAEPGALRQGLERLGQAEFEDAAALLRRALNDGDPWLEEQLRRYQELVYAGDLTHALAALRAAVLERQGYPDLQLLLGAHELQIGAVDDAIESLTQALVLNPDFHAARVQLARAFEALGDTPHAVGLLEQVLAADGGHGEARELHERLAARRRLPRSAVARG